MLDRVDNPDISKNYNEKGNVIFNNTNTNSGNVNITMNIEEIEGNIKNNTFLGDKEKEELLVKLIEITELKNSKNNKVEKWKKRK